MTDIKANAVPDYEPFPYEPIGVLHTCPYELEDYLEQKSKDGELIIGWVTGSSIESIIDKMGRGKFRYFPHFIASDLGTEITYFFFTKPFIYATVPLIILLTEVML